MYGKNRYPCRCRTCGHRKTLRKDPDYTEKKCSCGGVYRLDTYRKSGKEARKYNCQCGGIFFQPHRRKTIIRDGEQYCHCAAERAAEIAGELRQERVWQDLQAELGCQPVMVSGDDEPPF